MDGDGFADLVVASPGEEITAGATDEGALTVLRGTANGFVSQPSMLSVAADARQSRDRFGEALATGDFDHDGGDAILAVAPGSGRAWAVDGADRTFSTALALASGERTVRVSSWTPRSLPLAVREPRIRDSATGSDQL